MRMSQLTFLAFQFNYLLDRGYYVPSVEEVKNQIRNKELFGYLTAKTRDDYFDLSLLSDADRKELSAEFEGLADSVDEDRKMGVQRNGICLLLAYVIELIQRERNDSQAI